MHNGGSSDAYLSGAPSICGQRTAETGVARDGVADHGDDLVLRDALRIGKMVGH